VILFLFAFVYPITKIPIDSRLDLTQIFSHVLLVHNLNSRTFFGINGSFWSLAVEFQLYILYPFLIALIRRFGWGRTLLGIGAIEVGLRLAHGLLFTATGTGFPLWLWAGLPLNHWFSWSIGAFVAERHFRDSPLVITRTLIYLLTFCAFVSNFFKPLFYMSGLFFALLTAAILARLLSSTKDNLPISAPIRHHLQQVGIWSFSLYLLHQPLLSAISNIGTTFNIHPFLLFILCIASWFIIIKIAHLSYLFLELPSIAIGKFLYSRRASSYVVTHQAPRRD
jgi:peptidoglycan/LPS O-acetylase OafA/YrhL